MKQQMNIVELIDAVDEQLKAKRDFVASTEDQIKLVPMPDFPSGLALVILSGTDGGMERFKVSEHAHAQIASWLKIPAAYYKRLLADHPDLVMDQVNALFQREPGRRMIRTLDDRARAFLSDKYLRIDNTQVLAGVLPPLRDVESLVLSSNVTDDRMNIKVLFTDPKLAQEIGPAPQHFADGQNTQTRDLVHPGCTISTSEVGLGAAKITGFFYRDYCLNGCVFGTTEIMTYSRRHLGGKLLADEAGNVYTDETRRKQDELMVAEMRDTITALVSPEFAAKMGNKLRSLARSEKMERPIAAVDQLLIELPQIRAEERDPILEALMRDGDFSKWGALNAVTKLANSDEVSYERSTELEGLGWNIAELSSAAWNRITTAEAIAA